MWKRAPTVIISAIFILCAAISVMFYLEPEQKEEMRLEKKLRNWGLFAGIGGLMTAIGAVTATYYTFKIAQKTKEDDDRNFATTLNEFKRVVGLQEAADAARKLEFQASIDSLGIIGNKLHRSDQFRLDELQSRLENTVRELHEGFAPFFGGPQGQDTIKHREQVEKMIIRFVELTSQEYSNPHLYQNAELFTTWKKAHDDAIRYVLGAKGWYTRDSISYRELVNAMIDVWQVFMGVPAYFDQDGRLLRPAKDY